MVKKLHMTRPPLSRRGRSTLSARNPMGTNAKAYSTCAKRNHLINSGDAKDKRQAQRYEQAVEDHQRTAAYRVSDCQKRALGVIQF